MLAAGLKNTPVIHMLVAAGADVNLVSSLAGCTQSLKVWGKWDKLFKALKVCEN